MMIQHEKRRYLKTKTEQLVYNAYWSGKFLREREKHDFENGYFLWDADEPAQDE